MVDPPGQRRLQGVGVEPREERLEGAEGGGGAAIAEAVHQLDRLITAPLDDGGVSAAAAEEGTEGVGQQGDEGMSASVTRARVGNIGQEREQTAGGCQAHGGEIQGGGEWR
jgi:hypothetical protein